MSTVKPKSFKSAVAISNLAAISQTSAVYCTIYTRTFHGQILTRNAHANECLLAEINGRFYTLVLQINCFVMLNLCGCYYGIRKASL